MKAYVPGHVGLHHKWRFLFALMAMCHSDSSGGTHAFKLRNTSAAARQSVTRAHPIVTTSEDGRLGYRAC